MGSETSDVETCRLAMTVAQEEGLKECSSEASKKQVVADELGLDELPGEDVLEGTPDTIIGAREYVFARLFHGENPLLEANENDLYTALQAAWNEVDSIDEGEEDEDTDAPDDEDDPGEEADDEGVNLEEIDGLDGDDD